MPSIVLHTDLKGFQQQYGTLRKAVEAYWLDRMPDEQAAALERVLMANPGAWAIVHAVAVALNA